MMFDRGAFRLLWGQMLIGLASSLWAQLPTFDLEPVPAFFNVPYDGNWVQPTGVAVDSRGHVYVFNKGNRQLMEFDAAGAYVRSLGHGLFVDPHGLRIDRHDHIWTTDLETHLVLKMDRHGTVLMVLGQRNTPGLYDDDRASVLFDKPADVGFGANGDIYVADGYGNHRVAHLKADGEFVRAWGKKGSAQGEFDNPHNIVVDRNRVYVADRYNKRIQVFGLDGSFVSAWTHLGKPWGLAVSPERNLYAVDGDHEVIYKLDMEGQVLGKYTAGAGRRPGQLRAAHGLAVGPQEELYVTEILNWRVQKFRQKWQLGDWHRVHTTNCGHYRHESAFVEVGGKLIAFGGRNTLKVDIYDPVTRTWSQGKDSPLEMHHFQALVYKDEVWVIGAFHGPYPKEEPIAFLYVYNPADDSWRIGGRLPDGRHRASGGTVLYKDRFYLLCGNELGHFTGHTRWFDAFDPATGEWTTMPDAPRTRDHFQAVVIDNRLYAAGGRNSSALTGSVIDATFGEVDVFDFDIGTWSTLPAGAHIPTQRAGTMALGYDGHVIVMGGESGSQVPAHSEVEALDIETHQWKSLLPMLQGRHGTQAVLFDGKIWLAGGSSDRGGGPEMRSLDFWELKPIRN